MDTDEAVTALDLPMANPLRPETEKYFKLCTEKLGLIPNVLKAYAFDEDKLAAFSTLYNNLMLDESGISKLEREMIAVVVSSINSCYYCLTAHGATVRQLSGKPELGEQMVMNFRAASLSEREQTMLEFAEKLTKSPEAIVEEDRQALRDKGFSDRDIWDIAAVTAFFNMSNRVAAATDMRPNSEYHNMARQHANAGETARFVHDKRDEPV